MRNIHFGMALAVIAVAGAALACGVDVQGGVLFAAAAPSFVLNGPEARHLQDSLQNAFKSRDARIAELESRVLDVLQRGATRPDSGSARGGGGDSELVRLLQKSDGMESFLNGATPSFTLQVPSSSIFRNAVTNVPPGTTSPFWQPARRDIVSPAQQRLTVRSLFTQVPVENAGAVEVVTESTFTDGSAVQGGDASPVGAGEGSLKPESQVTFAVTPVHIPTIAHWIVASRQVLSDATMLQRHIEQRLLFYLALREEALFLTGSGSGLNPSGINTLAAAFTGGVTNATAIDTISRAFNQLSVNSMEASGVILHPTDWNAITLLKDTTGRYILGDPGDLTVPQLFGKTVVVTPSQTLGRFTAIDSAKYGYVADRESATVRLSENVGDAFLRNLVHILAEERSVLVAERPTAAIYGVLSHSG